MSDKSIVERTREALAKLVNDEDNRTDLLVADLSALEAEEAASAALPVSRIYACGCILCICNDERCHGCGAKGCGKSDAECDYKQERIRKELATQPSVAPFDPSRIEGKELDAPIVNRMLRDPLGDIGQKVARLERELAAANRHAEQIEELVRLVGEVHDGHQQYGPCEICAALDALNKE